MSMVDVIHISYDHCKAVFEQSATEHLPSELSF